MFRRTILGRFSGMKKLCSSFLVVERIYWTFGVNFLTIFSKLQPTGAAEVFWCFFGRKSNCLNVFGLWAEVTVFWQKNYGRLLKVNFACPQQNFEKKNDWSKLYYYHFSRTLNEFFSDSDKKSNQVCRNSNLNVQKENFIKKRSWTLYLSSFLDFDKKNLFF